MPNIFLDLEDTVIDSFNSGMILHKKCAAIRQSIDSIREFETAPIKTFIFSFAIHTQEELDHFNKILRPNIEQVLGVTIDGVITVPEMMAVSEIAHSLRFDDVTEFICLRGKEGAFLDWCNVKFLTTNFLFDDVVKNRTFQDHDTGVHCMTFNVDSLVGGWRGKHG